GPPVSARPDPPSPCCLRLAGPVRRPGLRRLAHVAVNDDHRTRSWEMKAVIMTAPAMDASTTSVADIGEPRPGPGQVAIDVAYAGVNFIDVMARRGDPGYASAWPYVPGLEVAGTVRSVGSGVHHLRPGERVA